MTGTKTERRKMEGMNQFGLQYIYTWKCNKKLPVWLSSTNKISFFFVYKIGEQEGRAGPV
jgi:hypothetical protein